MASAVEARSLSSLTSLASNPPKYPRNPTHQRLEPLVLYIARVPGSKDVFLTPVKPREKIVTAEDVQSCLYYVHVDQPDDDKHLEGDESPNQEQGIHETAQTAPAVSRKPLPSATAPSPQTALRPDQERPHPLPPLPPSPNWPPPVSEPVDASRPPPPPKIVTRKPVAPAVLSERTDVHNRHNVDAGLHPSGYFGSRPPPYQRGRSGTNGLSSNENRPPSTHARSRSDHLLTEGYSAVTLPPPYQPAYAYRGPSGNSVQPTRDATLSAPPPPPRAVSSSSIESVSSSRALGTAGRGVDPGTSLTLIRRDPMAGAQWNVAKIADPPIYEVSSNINSSMASKKMKQLGAPLYMEITTPGYTKFAIDDQARASLDQNRASVDGRSSIDSVSTMDSPQSGSPTDLPVKKGIFKRRMWMETSRLSDVSLGHNKTSSVGSDQSVATSRGSLEGRNSSEQFTDFPQLGPVPLANDGRLVADSYGNERRRSTSKGYSFMSPWNGRCEFTTGSAGRSLKCRHSLPAHHGASSAPAVVSELRFNLPALGALSTPATPGEDGSAPKKSSFFNRPRARRDHSSSSINNDDMFGLARTLERIDLSLGQEYAGGGFGGKQAKLGKLIVEDEGLKMLDLIVAANVALWWRAYEKF